MPDSLPLPSKWFLLEHDGEKFIYGLGCDIANFAYNFYCTNFNFTWTEHLSREAFTQKADKAGISTDHENLSVVLEALSNASNGDLDEHLSFEFSNLSKIKMEEDSDTLNRSFQAEFNNELRWVFELGKVNKNEHILLLSALNFQQFLNHDFLLYKIKELEKMLLVKDQFIQVLSENYSALGGDNLIKTYKKNNKVDLIGIEQYDQSIKEPIITSSYERYLRNKSKKRGWAGNIWSQISAAINDQFTWKFTSHLGSINTTGESVYPSKQDNFVKTEIKEEKKASKSKALKRELKEVDDAQPDTMIQKNSSPSKRGRNVPGSLPRRKR